MEICYITIIIKFFRSFFRFSQNKIKWKYLNFYYVLKQKFNTDIQTTKKTNNVWLYNFLIRQHSLIVNIF